MQHENGNDFMLSEQLPSIAWNNTGRHLVRSPLKVSHMSDIYGEYASVVLLADAVKVKKQYLMTVCNIKLTH